MLTCEERIEIIDDLSQQICDMCDKVMDSLEAELNDAELLHSAMYKKCGMLKEGISRSLK